MALQLYVNLSLYKSGAGSKREKTCLFLEHAPEGEPAERLHLTLHSSVRSTEQRSAQEGNSLSAQRDSPPHEKWSRGVAAQHDFCIRRESSLLTGDEEDPNRTAAYPLRGLSREYPLSIRRHLTVHSRMHA